MISSFYDYVETEPANTNVRVCNDYVETELANTNVRVCQLPSIKNETNLPKSKDSLAKHSYSPYFLYTRLEIANTALSETQVLQRLLQVHDDPRLLRPAGCQVKLHTAHRTPHTAQNETLVHKKPSTKTYMHTYVNVQTHIHTVHPHTSLVCITR